MPKSNRVATAKPVIRLREGATEITFDLADPTRVAAVRLQVAPGDFLKSVTLSMQDANGVWVTVEQGIPLFRKQDAHQLELQVDGRTTRAIRLSLDDRTTRPIAVTGAELLLAGEESTADPASVLPVVNTRQEFAGETVFTLQLQSAHVRIAGLELEAGGLPFSRPYRLTESRFRHGRLEEEVLAEGNLQREAGESSPLTRVSFPPATAHSRDLRLRISNQDSPTLAVSAISLHVRPLRVVLQASEAGQWVMLSGNPDAERPRYDLSGLPAFAEGIPLASPRQVRANPHFRSTPWPETLEAGAAFSGAGWSARRTVDLTQGGVQELELDPGALAGAASDLRDIRLSKDGHQVPFLIERPGLSRDVPLILEKSASTSSSVSRWSVRLYPNVTYTSLRLSTSATVFSRRIRVLAPATHAGGTDQLVGDFRWERSAASASSSVEFPLHMRLGATLILEVDEGDNAPLSLNAASIRYPVTRLLFFASKPIPGPSLHYGNPQASPPQYDLSLLAERFTTSPRNVATLDATAEVTNSPGFDFQQGWVVWTALAAVVAGLLYVIAKLLPRPQP